MTMLSYKPLDGRSIREMVAVSESLLMNHPSPDSPLSSFQQPTQCALRMCNREASYGSLLSILSEDSSQARSTCSFDEDSEGDSKHLLAMLERVDDVMYDGKVAENLNDKLKEDCLTWSKMFPHFRLNGRKMDLHNNDFDTPTEACPTSEIVDITTDLNDLVFSELIAEHHDHDVMVAFEEKNYESEEEILLTMQRIKDKVLAKLVEHLVTTSMEWRDATVVETSKPLRIRTAATSRIHERLRPRTAQETMRISLPQVISTPLRPLEGILVVSSKILQNRKSINSLSRPGSSITQLKPLEHGPTKLKGHFSKLSNNFEDVKDGKGKLRSLSVISREHTPFQCSTYPAIIEDGFRFSHHLELDIPSELGNKERPFTLPPVYDNSRQPWKGSKKSPGQKSASRRQKAQNNPLLSRPPSAKECPKFSNGELETLNYQGVLPVLSEESNFLKILPMVTNSSSAHQSRPRFNWNASSPIYRKV